MSDPFTSLRLPQAPADVDPGFRDRVLAEVRSRLVDDTDTDPVTSVAVVDARTHRVGHVRGFALVAAAVVAIAGTSTIALRSPTPPVDEPADTSWVASTTTVRSPDAQIADAGLLSMAEAGASQDFEALPGSITLDPETGSGIPIPECDQVLEIVYENPERPWTGSSRGYQNGGFVLQQYVVVFSGVSEAHAMMESIEEDGFAQCVAAVVNEVFPSAPDPEAFIEFEPARVEFESVEPQQPSAVGDEMTVLTIKGTIFTQHGEYAEDGLYAFVRVGRAVTWMKRNLATTTVTRSDVALDQLTPSLVTAAEHLRRALEL